MGQRGTDHRRGPSAAVGNGETVARASGGCGVADLLHAELRPAQVHRHRQPSTDRAPRRRGYGRSSPPRPSGASWAQLMRKQSVPSRTSAWTSRGIAGGLGGQRHHDPGLRPVPLPRQTAHRGGSSAGLRHRKRRKPPDRPPRIPPGSPVLARRSPPARRSPHPARPAHGRPAAPASKARDGQRRLQRASGRFRRNASQSARFRADDRKVSRRICGIHCAIRASDRASNRNRRSSISPNRNRARSRRSIVSVLRSIRVSSIDSIL